MKIDEHDRFVFFAGRKAAVDPIFRDSMTGRQNELQILTIGDFAVIKRCRGEKIHR